MAVSPVSHQWFIQWSSPQIVVSDIGREFDKISHQWNGPVWDSFKGGNVPGTSAVDTPATKVNTLFDRNVYQRPFANYMPIRYGYGFNDNTNGYRNVPNDLTRVAALTLWLTSLGVARAQSLPADTDTPPFNTLYKWKHIDFEFPSPRHRRHALATGQYVPPNVLPLGVEVWGSRVWVTLPRWRSGVPATLATVPRAGGTASPPLKPYPAWSHHQLVGDTKNCTGLTSVFRVSADSCGRLWVLDSGQIDSENQPNQICPPTIFVFNMLNDQLLARYTIPQKYVLQGSLFSNIIVDTRAEDCSDLHAYIADTWRFGLLVFRLSDHRFWRFTHHLFYPDPLASNYTLHDLNFQWTDGILGMALSPIVQFEPRTLYFHSMSSYREFSVSTEILQNEYRVKNSANEFHIVGNGRGEYGQSSGSAIDRRGVLFYGLVTRDSIGCWNTQNPYAKEWLGVTAKNTETLVFPNDIKVDQDARQSVWVLSNRLPYFQAKRMNSDEYNFRIMYAETTEAARGTACDPDLHRRYKSILERDFLLL